MTTEQSRKEKQRYETRTNNEKKKRYKLHGSGSYKRQQSERGKDI